MRTCILHRGVLAIMAVLALLVPTTPASATTTITIALQATWLPFSGLTYPCVAANAPNTARCPVIAGPSATVEVTPTTGVTAPIGGLRQTFSFSSSVCISEAARLIGTTTLKAAAGLCTLTASGLIVGHCHGFHGTGTAQVTATSETVPPYLETVRHPSIDFQLVMVGAALIVTPRPPSTTATALVGVAHLHAIPGPGTGMELRNFCTSEANSFVLSGSVTLIDQHT